MCKFVKAWFDKVRKRPFYSRFGSATPTPTPSPTPTPTPTPASSGPALGFNVNNTSWYYENSPFTNIFQGEAWQADNQADPNGYIHAADLGSDHYPHSMPGTATYVQKVLTIPPVAGNFNVTWNGTGLGSFALLNATVVTAPSYIGSAGSAVINIPNAQDNSTFLPAVLRFAITSSPNYAHDFRVSKVGSAGEVDSTFQAKVASLTSTGGFLRPMDLNGVNENFGQSTSQIGSPKVTAATRNTPLCGDWTHGSYVPGNTDIVYSDGLPIELGIAMANATGRNLMWQLHWNGSDDYFNKVFDVVLNGSTANGISWSPLNPALTFAVGVANEVWNFGFNVALQARAEANAKGLLRADTGTTPCVGSGEGYVDKLIHVMDLASAAWAAHVGPKPTLQRTAEWQNASAAGGATTILNYLNCKAHVDAYATAPYIDLDGSVDQSQNPFTALTVDQIFDMLIANTDQPLINARAAKDVAVALGLKYQTYEAGLELTFADAAFMKSVVRHARMFDFTINYVQKFELIVGDDPLTWYMNTGAVSSKNSWGLDEYTGQPISLAATPKAKALVDFQAGIRKLFAATGSVSAAPQGSGADVILGTLRPSVKGSTRVLTTVPANALALVDPTANSLQIKTTGVVAFTPGTVINWTLTETDARDSAGPKLTTGSFTVTGNSTAYLDYRILVTDTADSSNLGLVEVEMALTPGGTDVTAGQTYTDSSHFSGSYTAAKVFDDNLGTEYASGSGSLPEWIRVTFGTTKVINQLKMTARSGGAELQAPKTWKLQGSNTGGSSWVDIISRTSEPTWTAGETRTYVA